MNNMLRNISFGTVLLLVAGTAVTAKEWRGIVPLKSTRQDVERLFGVTLVDYSPEASHDNLHCPRIDNCCFSFRSQFDEYDEGRIFLYRRSDPDEAAPRKPLRSKVGRTHEPQDRTLQCRYTNQYSIVEVANPKRKKDSDVVVPRDLNIVIGDKVLAKIELPTEAEVKNFSLNSIKKNKTGFELKVDWGGGLYHYAIQFNFKCKETGFYLYKVTKESFSTSNPASGKFLDKKESKVNKIEPNLPIERFSITDYL